MKTLNTINSKTIVFVTGAFVSHLGWAEWQTYFEAKGYKTLAPAWIGKEGTPQELRALHPNNKILADLTLGELIDHYANIIKALPEKPIIIGHSLGGLMTQVLLDRGLAAAAIVVDSVPPQGILPYEFSFLKAGWKSLGLFTSMKKTYLMSFKDWQYAFVNGMSLADQKKAYEENTIPESKRVARGGLTSAAKVDFNRERAPLLMIAGTTDTIIPAHLNKRNFKAYGKNTKSITDFVEFDHNHFVVGLPNFKRVTDYISQWIDKHQA
jgi:pimeloyl-ACP methyl ester carboxylesterase